MSPRLAQSIKGKERRHIVFPCSSVVLLRRIISSHFLASSQILSPSATQTNSKILCGNIYQLIALLRKNCIHYIIMTVKRILNFLAVAEQEEKKTKSVNDVLMRTPYYHAKTNNMKIYSPKEIESATGMEKKRRQFWNDKAEQLAQNQKTRNQSKTVLSGLIDVSWTLRKTSMLESDVKKLLDEEKVLFRNDDVAGKKLGTQKKDTISKNVERMSAAHHAVEAIDQEVEEVQEAFQAAQTLVDRRKYSKEYERKKLLLDGAYTELKRAQDALTKSMKAKERDIENRLAERSGYVDVEEDDACPSSLGEI